MANFRLKHDNLMVTTQGLYWVLKYYHVGVDAGGSWSWYFPHLYAPLASDMRGLMEMDISFVKGR